MRRDEADLAISLLAFRILPHEPQAVLYPTRFKIVDLNTSSMQGLKLFLYGD